GWILILTAPVLGALLPGPGGLPVFLIGFALVTFPGKRKLTARVLRGRRLHIEDRAFTGVALFISIAIPGIAWWIIWARYENAIRKLIEDYTPKKSVFVLAPLLAIVLTWLVTRISLKILNGLLKLLPKVRRKFRPWLRKKGLKLLPPRRRKLKNEPPLPEDEILELSAHHQRRFLQAWTAVRPWIRRAAALAVTIWIFTIMIEPLGENWPIVREQIASIEWWRFALASLMFASFLLFFRAMAWRRILKSFGYRLPYAPAARIWATSEMARYLPGAIWQVVGRVYLAKPYGVPAAVVTTSQILEVCLFLFANVLIAASCLLYFGAKMAPQTWPWLVTALVLIPTLSFLLHPKIFYGITNYVLVKLNKPPIVKRLPGRKLVELLMWMILGLVFQSLAVYLITDPVLHLKLAWWWVVAGAYCLAWCAGFLAFWAPGGIGVRELVFVTTMQLIAPAVVKEHFSNPSAFLGLLVFLGFVLRAWTVAGEVLLVAATHAWDYRGAMNDPAAPGRVPTDAAAVIPTPAAPPALARSSPAAIAAPNAAAGEPS
ncbi:MAG: glycosyltransferase 2 family protein, partial [Phycisphaerales bacterium]|nr:glycosyltransferase 2 family protein [Phycisphaerales bacterium]